MAGDINDAAAVVRALQEGKGVAWVSPGNDLVPGGAADGMPPQELFAGTPVAELIESVRDDRCTMAEIKASAEELLERDRHPEWHRYDCARMDHDNSSDRATLALNALGWVRLDVDEEWSPRLLVRATAERLEGVAVALDAAAAELRRPLVLRPADEAAIAGLRATAPASKPLVAPDRERPRDRAARELWDGAVASLARDGFGWLTPDGGIVTCGLHGHLAAVRGTGVHQRWFEEIDATASRLAAARANVAEARAAGDVPQVLSNGMAAADTDLQALRSELVGRLYGEGWVRLGSREDAAGRILSAESSLAPLRAAQHVLRGLASATDASLSARTPEGVPAFGGRSRFGGPFGRLSGA